MTKKGTLRLLAILCAAYPRANISADEVTVAIWHDMLIDLDDEVVAVAVKRMIATLRFPPSIADVRGAVLEAARELRGTPDAGEAWQRVVRAISAYGYYSPDQAREALGGDIWRAVEMMGGWSRLCLSESPMSALSAQFERRYGELMEKRARSLLIPAGVREDMARLMKPLSARLELDAAWGDEDAV